MSSSPRLPRSLPLLIAALSTMGPFSIDAYLPSFHEIERSLGCTFLQVQQSLTFFLLPFAFMSLWHGALSDSFGRKRTIVVALSILAAASIGCALAPNIHTLWFFRVMQGLAAGVFVIGRAVVRDVYEGAAAQRVMSQVSVLFAIAPAVAPILGGQLHVWLGWRSVFVFLALLSGLVALAVALFLPETHPVELRHPFHARRLLYAYRLTLTHRGFLAASMAGAFGFAAVFLYVAAAPVLLVNHLHIPETQFIWLFGPVTSGLMLGGWLSGRVAGRLDAKHTLGWSFALMIVASIMNITFHALHPAALPWSMVPLFFYATGIALALPTLTLICLDHFPLQRGLAASCQAFLLTGANAAMSGLVAPAASATPLTLALASASVMVLGLCWLPLLRGKDRAALRDPEFPVPE